jgi:hypothetical protein
MRPGRCGPLLLLLGQPDEMWVDDLAVGIERVGCPKP